jgi:hypothetical protein
VRPSATTSASSSFFEASDQLRAASEATVENYRKAAPLLDPSGTLLVITVYEPEPPNWLDERTRNPAGGAL